MEKSEVNLREDVKPSNISSALVSAPFDVAKAELERNGYRIISLEEAARLRMDENSIYSEYGKNEGGFHFVKEGVLYLPNKGLYITKNSPILDFPEEATQAHKEEREFYLTDKQVKRALEDSLWIPEENFRVSTSEIEVLEYPNSPKLTFNPKIKLDTFGDNVLTRYLFGREAPKYGESLRSIGSGFFSVINVNAPRNFEKSFVRPIIFDCEASDNPSIDSHPSDFNGGDPTFFLNGDNEHSRFFEPDESHDKFEPYYFPVRGIKEVE